MRSRIRSCSAKMRVMLSVLTATCWAKDASVSVRLSDPIVDGMPGEVQTTAYAKTRLQNHGVRPDRRRAAGHLGRRAQRLAARPVRGDRNGGFAFGLCDFSPGGGGGPPPTFPPPRRYTAPH